jgi:hypothetical protein
MDQLKFDEYRFHFRPYGSRDLFIDPETQMNIKNTILQGVLNNSLTFNHRRVRLKYQHTDLGEGFHHFRIANKKYTKIEKNFLRTNIENEPSANVFLWNDIDEQKILIESDKTSFGESKVVAKIIENSLNSRLAQEGLALSVNAEIEESEFWDLVNKYEGRIKSLEFQLLYPNLPKSHSVISEELEEVFKGIGSSEGNLKFKAEDGHTLRNLHESNRALSSLNTAASIQGMPITIRIEKERHVKKTGKSKKTVTIIEVIIQDPKELLKIAKKYLK